MSEHRKSRPVVEAVGSAYFQAMSEQPEAEKTPQAVRPTPPPLPKEIGGPKGPEPTRYGDWEVNGRCSDF
jgi:hypothetical protein